MDEAPRVGLPIQAFPCSRTLECSNVEHHGNIDKLQDRQAQHTTLEPALVAEICARLLEWRSLSPALTESKPTLWLLRLSSLAQDNPDALWLYLSIQSGDLSALTITYQDQASLRHTSRQAIEQKLSRAHQAMSLHFPELKSALDGLQSLCRPPRGINTKDNGDSPTP